MRIFVESLKRLFVLEQIDKNTIDKLLVQKKISDEEVAYILGKDGEE